MMCKSIESIEIDNIGSDSKHIPIRTFGYGTTKIERNNQLLDNMTVEEKRLSQEYESCANEITSKNEFEIFIEGFRFGIRLALELIELQN